MLKLQFTNTSVIRERHRENGLLNHPAEIKLKSNQNSCNRSENE